MRATIIVSCCALLLGALCLPAGAEEQTFPVLEYRVLHNSVLTTRQVESAVYPHLGPGKTLQDVQAARADLEKAYHDSGYATVFVDVPEQSVENGVVRLQVTEGRVGRLRVTGTRYYSNRRIVAAVPSLAPGEVPHFPDVQADMTALNHLSPDLSVAPVLRPGATAGTMDVDLKVKDNLPLHASVQFDNNATPDTRPDRLTVNASYGNLFELGHTISLQLQTAPQDPSNSTVFTGSYLLPVGSSGQSLSLYGLKSNSNVATSGTLGVLGKGSVIGTRYTVPLPQAGPVYSSLVLGVDYKDFDETVSLATGALETPIKYLNWSTLYGAAIQTNATHTTFDAAANFGIRGLLNHPDEFESKRYLAAPNYFYLHFDVAHDRPLVWGTRLALRLSGQLTNEPLIDNEQFAIGGLDSVRGYLVAEELGDRGVSGTVELRSPSLPSLFGLHPREAYLYVFYDGGVVEVIDPLPQQQAHMDLLSQGAGLRVVGFSGFDAGLDYARTQVGTAYERAGDWRVLFLLRYGF